MCQAGLGLDTTCTSSGQALFFGPDLSSIIQYFYVFLLWHFANMRHRQCSDESDHIHTSANMSTLPYPSFYHAIKLWLFTLLQISTDLADNHSPIITPILSHLLSLYEWPICLLSEQNTVSWSSLRLTGCSKCPFCLFFFLCHISNLHWTVYIPASMYWG